MDWNLNWDDGLRRIYICANGLNWRVKCYDQILGRWTIVDNGQIEEGWRSTVDEGETLMDWILYQADDAIWAFNHGSEL
jgi:hypothetical protein